MGAWSPAAPLDHEATTFLPMTTPFFNKGTKGNAYDLNKAKQLVKESGVQTPVTLKLLFRSNDAVHQPTAVALKEMWSKIGVNLELDPLDRPRGDRLRDRGKELGGRLRSQLEPAPEGLLGARVEIEQVPGRRHPHHEIGALIRDHRERAQAQEGPRCRLLG